MCRAVMSEYPTNGFGFARDDVEVEVRNRLRRAEAALQALHDVDLGVREEGDEVGRAATRIAGDVVVTVEDAVGELDPVPLRLPPLDAAQDLRARVVRARRRSDSDRAAGGQRTTEEGGLTHEGRSSFRTGGKGKILPDAASAMRSRRRSSSPREVSRCCATLFLEPGPGRTRTAFPAERGELVPEIRADIGVAQRRPDGTWSVAPTSSELDAERLVAEIGAEPVEADAGERPGGEPGLAGAQVLQCLLEASDVGRRLLVRIARALACVEPVQAHGRPR